ncbi:MAG: aspartate 1-decarboxylase [Candidatus Marinimicrobia bacterium]|nr:aspartate 1-decarboxylase [Candidatus Neomarinimicrobiota bacterium]
MKRLFLHSKIHRAVVTEANLNYTGSISIPEDLMEMANVGEFEQVQVANINNGIRFETYVIKGKRGSKNICLNGAAARLAQLNDRIIIMSYADLEPEEIKTHKPIIIVLDETNTVIEKTGE